MPWGKFVSVVGVRVSNAFFTTAKFYHYLTQLVKEKFSSGGKLVVVKIALFVQFLYMCWQNAVKIFTS